MNGFYYTERQHYLRNYIFYSPQVACASSVLPCSCKTANAGLKENWKHSLASLLWKAIVVCESWERDTGYLLTMLVPTHPSEAWFQKRHALLERTGTMLTSTGFLNLFIQDREKRDLNTVTSDPQQRGCRWHALSMDMPDTAANMFDLSQCDPQKGTACAETQASHAVLCLLGVCTEHPQVIKLDEERANCSNPAYRDPLWDAVCAFKSDAHCTKVFTAVRRLQMENNATVEAIMQLVGVVTSQFFLHLQHILFQKIVLMLLRELQNCYNRTC